MRDSLQERPFGFRDKIGYLFGDFGNDFSFILSTVLLMKFYTDVLGVSGGTVGAVMMAARFTDGFTDLAMGRICDRSKIGPQGKFKPWILRMCLPVAATSFLMYQNFLSGWPGNARVIWLTVTYILWSSVFYTSINIPYGSMASAVSPEPQDRQSLSTYRTVGGTLAGLIVGIAVPFYAYVEKDGVPVLDGRRVTLLAAFFSVLGILCHLICYRLVTERVREPAQKRNTIPLRKTLGQALTNRALLSIIAASAVMLLAQLTMQNMAAYIYPDYYGTVTAQSVSTIVMIAGMFLAAFFSKKMTEKFGKAEISAASAFFSAAICLFLFFLRPDNVWVYVALQGICWLGLGVFAMVNWALITDVIDDAELKTGIREDGVVYSLYSFARKTGQALAAGASGWLLDRIGYQTGIADVGTGQAEEVLEGIFNISTLIPAAGFFILSIILFFWYPLRKSTVERNQAELRKKKKENERSAEE